MHSLAPAPPQEQYHAQPVEQSAPSFQADVYFGIESGRTIDVSQFEPLLTAEQATEQLGFPSGALGRNTATV